VSTLVVYSDTTDGRIRSNNAVYATARSGGTLTVATSATAFEVGQEFIGSYSLFESFLSFDTSSIGSGSAVSAAILALTSQSDVSETDFTIEARLYDWGASVGNADWVAGAGLSALTLLANRPTSSGWVAETAYDLTNVAFPENVNKAGSTSLLLCSDRLTAGTAPTQSEHVLAYSADQTGTTSDPKLTVTYAAGGRTPDGSGPTINAVLAKSASGTFTASAAIKRNQSGSFAANAVLAKSASGTFAADAVFAKSASGTFTAAAIFGKTQTGSLTFNAVIKASVTGTKTADAIRLRTFHFGSGVW